MGRLQAGARTAATRVPVARPTQIPTGLQAALPAACPLFLPRSASEPSDRRERETGLWASLGPVPELQSGPWSQRACSAPCRESRGIPQPSSERGPQTLPLFSPPVCGRGGRRSYLLLV